MINSIFDHYERFIWNLDSIVYDQFADEQYVNWLLFAEQIVDHKEEKENNSDQFCI